MADVHPFRGLHYNFKNKSEMETLLAPPFDLIPYDQRQKLLSLNSRNVVRLILGDISTFPPNTSPKMLHEESAALMNRWKEERVLVQDEAPSMYLIEDHFSWGGETYIRKGLFLTVSLEPLGKGKILPHEQTLQGPIRERFGLLENTLAHLSPVFMTFHDQTNDFQSFLTNDLKLKLMTDFVDQNTQTRHRLHQIFDETSLKAIQNYFHDHSFLIADGHHRYTTAFEFSQKHPELAEAHRMMICLVSSSDPGLILGSIHRGIQTSLSQTDIFEKLSSMATIEPMTPSWRAFEKSEAPLAILGRNQAWSISPHDHSRDDLHHSPTHLFNEMILDRILNLNVATDDFLQTVSLLHSPEEALKAGEQEAQFGFWLKPMTIPEVMTVAQKGFRLPQKATFFWPKIMSGLLFHSLD